MSNENTAKNPNCACPITRCKRHSDCKACLANHKGNGFCKRPNWQQSLIKVFIKPKAKIGT